MGGDNGTRRVRGQKVTDLLGATNGLLSGVPSGHDGRDSSFKSFITGGPIYVKGHWQSDVLATGKSRTGRLKSLPYVGVSISFTETVSGRVMISLSSTK